MGILFIILGIVGLLYAIFWVFKYELIVRWFNKWAKVDFVPEKRWNKLLLHGVGAVVGSSLLVALFSLLVTAIFMNKDTPTNELSPIWGILFMVLNFGGVFVYAYLYVRYRVSKRAISKRQAVWEMIYGRVVDLCCCYFNIFGYTRYICVFGSLCDLFCIEYCFWKECQGQDHGAFFKGKEFA